MKAYRGIDNEIRMFRPMHNMTRMLVSARRSCLPEFDPHELVHCIRHLEGMQDLILERKRAEVFFESTLVDRDVSAAGSQGDSGS